MFVIRDTNIKKIIRANGGIYTLCVFTLLSTVCNCYVPVATGIFIDGLINHSPVTSMLVKMVLFAVLAICFSALNDIIGSHCSHNLEMAIQHYILKTTNTLPPIEADNIIQKGGSGKFLRDATTLSSISRRVIGLVVNALIYYLITICILFYKNAILGCIGLILLPACFLPLRIYTTYYDKTCHRFRIENDKCMSRVYCFLLSLPYLKAMNAVFPLSNRLLRAFTDLKTASQKVDMLDILFDYMLRVFVLLGEYGVLLVGGILVVNGRLTAGDLVALQILILQTLHALTNLFSGLPLFETVKEGITSIEEFTMSDAIENDKGKRDLASFQGNITMSHVSYHYQGQDKLAINDVSISISKGKCVAIVGANGAGKTTLAKHLSCYAIPTSGEICYDGVNQNELNRDSLRDKISILFQDSMLISGTIRENITLGKDYCEEELNDVIEVCGLNEIIARKSNGLDTLLENDKMLSGGERQRVALARVLIRKPVLAILDEVTNHLDAEGEALVTDLLPRLKKNCAVVIITHDKKIMQLADEVIHLSG